MMRIISSMDIPGAPSRIYQPEIDAIVLRSIQKKPGLACGVRLARKDLKCDSSATEAPPLRTTLLTLDYHVPEHRTPLYFGHLEFLALLVQLLPKTCLR